MLPNAQSQLESCELHSFLIFWAHYGLLPKVPQGRGLFYLLYLSAVTFRTPAGQLDFPCGFLAGTILCNCILSSVYLVVWLYRKRFYTFICIRNTDPTHLLGRLTLIATKGLKEWFTMKSSAINSTGKSAMHANSNYCKAHTQKVLFPQPFICPVSSLKTPRYGYSKISIISFLQNSYWLGMKLYPVRKPVLQEKHNYFKNYK